MAMAHMGDAGGTVEVPHSLLVIDVLPGAPHRLPRPPLPLPPRRPALPLHLRLRALPLLGRVEGWSGGELQQHGDVALVLRPVPALDQLALGGLVSRGVVYDVTMVWVLAL